jgi:hypothetical protein
MNHLRRITLHGADSIRWKQCIKPLQNFEAECLKEIVAPLQNFLEETGAKTGDPSHSAASSTPRKSLSRLGSDTSQVSCDSSDLPKCPAVNLSGRKHLERNHSEQSALSCDSYGLPKCPAVNFSGQALLPKKAWALLKKPAAAIAEPSQKADPKAKPTGAVEKALLKRPAAAITEPPVIKASGKAKAKAKPTGVTKASAKPQNALKLRPEGCSKCRRVPGCTNSCWRQRGY